MAEKSTFSKAKEGLKAALSVKDFWQTTTGFRGVLVWAAICDLLSAIPWVGLIFSGLGYGSIWLYLEMNSVSASPIGSSKRMAATAAEWIAGAFGLGIVPGISVWTYFAIAEHKGEATTEKQDDNDTEEKREETDRSDKIVGEIKPTKKRQKTSAYMKDAA